jgi:ketosteroid isomerase-like protein
VAALRRRLEQWFGSFRGPIGFEVHDLTVTATDQLAFCSSLNRVTGTKTDGAAIDMYWRATLCFAKRDGRWVVTHSHSSVPFDMDTGRASLDLKP